LLSVTPQKSMYGIPMYWLLFSSYPTSWLPLQTQPPKVLGSPLKFCDSTTPALAVVPAASMVRSEAAIHVVPMRFMRETPFGWSCGGEGCFRDTRRPLACARSGSTPPGDSPADRFARAASRAAAQTSNPQDL